MRNKQIFVFLTILLFGVHAAVPGFAQDSEQPSESLARPSIDAQTGVIIGQPAIGPRAGSVPVGGKDTGTVVTTVEEVKRPLPTSPPALTTLPMATSNGTAQPLSQTVSNPQPLAMIPQPGKKSTLEKCAPYLMIGGAVLAATGGIGLVLNEMDGGFRAGEDKAARPGDINSKTEAQVKCAQEAPAKPGRIVIGFEGLGGYSYGGGLYRNFLTPAQKTIPRTQTHYYSQAAVSDNTTLSDAVRCAYELATKPYKTKDGKTVYNTITIMGYSYGGHAASQAVENLRRLGIHVDLVVTADPREKWTLPNVTFSKPNTVRRWVNYYENWDLPLRGFPVGGAENHLINSPLYPHVRLTGHSTVQNGALSEVQNLPLCRTSFKGPVILGSMSCD